MAAEAWAEQAAAAEAWARGAVTDWVGEAGRAVAGAEGAVAGLVAGAVTGVPDPTAMEPKESQKDRPAGPAPQQAGLIQVEVPCRGSSACHPF